MIRVQVAPPEHFDWLAKRADLVAVKGAFWAMEAMEGDRILGMIGYDGWTPNSCCIHIAIDSPIAVRRLIRPGFSMPFLEWKRGVLIAAVLSTNTRSLKLTEHFGFQEKTRIMDGWTKGVDLVIFEMRQENCRYLRGV